MTAHVRTYVLVSAIHTLTLCMCIIVCTMYMSIYSTSVEHNVTLKTSMHIVIACCVSVLLLQTYTMLAVC